MYILCKWYWKLHIDWQYSNGTVHDVKIEGGHALNERFGLIDPEEDNNLAQGGRKKRQNGQKLGTILGY